MSETETFNFKTETRRSYKKFTRRDRDISKTGLETKTTSLPEGS